MTATLIARATVHGVRLLGDAVALAVGVMWALLTALIKGLLPPPRPKGIVGDVVLVTGAASTLARNVALLLAARGATVVCWDSDAASNAETVRLIRCARGKAMAYVVDASDRDEAQLAAGQVRRDVGVVTLLVVGAVAAPPRAPLLQQPSELVEHAVCGNLLALLWTLQAFLPGMLERGHGHVVALASGNALNPEPLKVPYCAAQFALRGLMEALEAEVHRNMRAYGIKFTTIYTGNFIKKRSLEAHRFSFMPVLSAQQMAETVVDAILKNCRERSIPALLLPVSHLQRLLPRSVLEMTNKFLQRATELD